MKKNNKLDTVKLTLPNKKYFADLKTNKKECCKEFVKENGVLHELRKITRDWYKKVDWKNHDYKTFETKIPNKKDKGVWVEIGKKLEGTPQKMVRVDLDAYRKRIKSMRPEDIETEMNYYKVRRFLNNDDILYNLVQLIKDLIPPTVSKTIQECDKEYDDFAVNKY